MTDGRKTKKAHYSLIGGLRRHLPVNVPYKAGGVLSAGRVVDSAHCGIAHSGRNHRLADMEAQKRHVLGGVCD